MRRLIFYFLTFNVLNIADCNKYSHSKTQHTFLISTSLLIHFKRQFFTCIKSTCCSFNLYSPVNRRKLFFIYFSFCQFIVILPFEIGPKNKKDMSLKREREREREREKETEFHGKPYMSWKVRWDFFSVCFKVVLLRAGLFFSEWTKCAHVCTVYY